MQVACGIKLNSFYRNRQSVRNFAYLNSTDNSWEPEANILDPDLIATFKAQKDTKAAASGAGKRKVTAYVVEEIIGSRSKKGKQ
jgi:hypothetical protein